MHIDEFNDIHTSGALPPLPFSKDSIIFTSLQAADSLYQGPGKHFERSRISNTIPTACANMSNTSMSSRTVRIAECISSEPRRTATPVPDAPEVLTNDISLCRPEHVHFVDNPAGGDVSNVWDRHRATSPQTSRRSGIGGLRWKETCVRSSRIKQPGPHQIHVGFLPGR